MNYFDEWIFFCSSKCFFDSLFGFSVVLREFCFAKLANLVY